MAGSPAECSALVLSCCARPFAGALLRSDLRRRNAAGVALTHYSGFRLLGLLMMNNMLSPLIELTASLRHILCRLPCWCVAACLLLYACAISSAAACPLQAPKARFTDLAGLPGLHADKIADRLAEYQHVSGHQLVVMVVPSLDGGASIEECAVAVFQNWKIGRKGVDDGVLLLVAVKEHKMRIEVGYGLEGVLTDAQSSRIIHEVMQPLFARGEFSEGIDRGLTAIMAVIGSSGPMVAADTDSTGDSTALKVFGAFFLLIFLVASPILGIVGLLAVGAAANGVAHWMYPGWGGHLLAAAWVIAWCALRWWTIQANVRLYRLPDSRNKALTWLWCFIVFGKAGQRRQGAAGASAMSFTSTDDGWGFRWDTVGDSAASRPDRYVDSGTTSSSDSDRTFGSDSSSSSSSGGGSDLSSDSGGSSGGGGASGDW